MRYIGDGQAMFSLQGLQYVRRYIGCRLEWKYEGQPEILQQYRSERERDAMYMKVKAVLEEMK